MARNGRHTLLFALTSVTRGDPSATACSAIRPSAPESHDTDQFSIKQFRGRINKRTVPRGKERLVIDNHSQQQSPAYRLAATDPDFILGDSMRGVRFLLEYAKAEESLGARGIRSTLVVFGSARVSADGNAQASRWYDEARKFGRIVSERGGALTPLDGIRDNVIATGGGPGIMEAANRGASEAGAPTIGFNIHLPREQMPNPYTTPELTFQFHYFAMRK